MFKLSNISHLKTTIIGILLMLASFGFQFYLFNKADFELNYYCVGILVAGLGFLFAPNNMIELLKSIITKKQNESK